MKKSVLVFLLSAIMLGFFTKVDAQQNNKNRKSRYYQNNMKEPEEFDVQGFVREPEKKEVEETPKKEVYDVEIRTKETEDKYKKEKRVVAKKEPRVRRTRIVKKVVYQELPNDREVKMTTNEVEYKTTFVKKRYTNLDVLCDDLDLAKIQRPVFKGVCEECSRDVDAIITNKNLSSLEKNYQLKQCYMLRDKRLKETIDEDQYKKFLRIKDADEYLVITKDLEQKDGIHK